MSRKFENVIILSDFDGTFCRDIKNLGVPKRNLEAIEYFKNEGGHFTFSTGRLPNVFITLLPNYEEICNCPATMGNGTIFYDPENKKIIEEHRFSEEKGLLIAKEVSEKFGKGIDRFYYFDKDGNVQNEIDFDKKEFGEWFKLVIVGKTEAETLEIKDYLKSHYADRFNFFRSADIYLEMVDKSVSKRRYLGVEKEYVSKKTGIKKEDIIICCIGDYENDKSALEGADYSFCPSNAIEKIKQVCDYEVCECTAGAIADMIDIIENKIIGG